MGNLPALSSQFRRATLSSSARELATGELSSGNPLQEPIREYVSLSSVKPQTKARTDEQRTNRQNINKESSGIARQSTCSHGLLGSVKIRIFFGLDLDAIRDLVNNKRVLGRISSGYCEL